MRKLLSRFFMNEDGELEEITISVEVEEETLEQQKATSSEEENLDGLRGKQNLTADKLDAEKARNSELSAEAFAWEETYKSKVEQLRQKDEQLYRNYNALWERGEQFCSELEAYMKHFERFQKIDNSKRKYTALHVKQTDLDVKVLAKKMNQWDAFIDLLDDNLIELEKKEKTAMEERNSSDIIRLKEWIVMTCTKCAELGVQIEEKKRRINEKNAIRNRYRRRQRNNLFSFVNLDDVRKL